jgi:hypothetical protein
MADMLHSGHSPTNQWKLDLSVVRDSEASARNTSSGGALISEAHMLMSAFHQGLPFAELRSKTLHGDVFRKASYASRIRNFNSIRHRYLDAAPGWITASLAKASTFGPESIEFLSLAYLYFALRDCVIFDFITGPLYERWESKITNVSSGDVQSFLQSESEKFPVINKWTRQTRQKLATNALSSLRDFNLLTGKRIKQIQRPAIAAETVFHLLCILVAEGREGNNILTAGDWRLFLWSESNTAHALSELAQKKWIRFEKSGRAVVLELVRQPKADT